MTKQKQLDIFQTAYELLCFVGCLAITSFIKEGVGKTIPFLFLPFLFIYLSKNAAAQKIAFAIVLTFLSYCTWSVIVTFYFTSFLYVNFITEEHSLWDPFAFLIPIVLTAWTLFWSWNSRIEKPKYEVCYLIILFITLIILTNIR